jgi:hypothetical protein
MPKTSTAAAAPLPLFYQEPQAVSSEKHALWRLKDGDYAFAMNTAFIPIVAVEIVLAAHDYPIVFTAEGTTPVAITGLENRNLFVTDNQWDGAAYIPAYVRRYPFAFMSTGEPGQFALAIDAASSRVVRKGEEGVPLFVDGKPSDLTQQVLEFCDTFQGQAAATAGFCEALSEQGLLVERRADATLPDGRKLGLDGFQVIDARKLDDLPDALVVEWHRKGWLSLAYAHIASLERFRRLLARQSAST